jgi:hypothetical protein
MDPFNQTKPCTWYYHLVDSFLLKFKVGYQITQTNEVKIKTDYHIWWENNFLKLNDAFFKNCLAKKFHL